MLFSSKLSSQGWISLPVSPNCVCAQLCLILCDPKNCTPQAFLSMEFSSQELWNGFLFPTPGDLPDPEIEPASTASLGITTGPPGKPYLQIRYCKRARCLSWNIFQHGLENYLQKFYPTEVSSGWTFKPEQKCTKPFKCHLLNIPISVLFSREPSSYSVYYTQRPTVHSRHNATK